MDKHYIEDLSIKQIEAVLKNRKELEAVFLAPAAKAAKKLKAQAEAPATEAKPKKTMSKAARKKLSDAATARWKKAKKAGKTTL
jgi:hypothetical protein